MDYRVHLCLITCQWWVLVCGHDALEGVPSDSGAADFCCCSVFAGLTGSKLTAIVTERRVSFTEARPHLLIPSSACWLAHSVSLCAQADQEANGALDSEHHFPLTFHLFLKQNHDAISENKHLIIQTTNLTAVPVQTWIYDFMELWFNLHYFSQIRMFLFVDKWGRRGEGWEGLRRITTSLWQTGKHSSSVLAADAPLCVAAVWCKCQHVQATAPLCCVASQQVFMVRFFSRRRRERGERDLLRQVRRGCRVTNAEEGCRKDRGKGGDEEGGGGRGRGVRTRTTTARFRWERRKKYEK